MDQANDHYNDKSLNAHNQANQFERQDHAKGLTAAVHQTSGDQTFLAAKVTATAIAVSKSDQELVQISAQHEVNRRAILDCPQDPDVSPFWPAYSSSSKAISNARPKTLAGLAAKARAAKSEAFVDEGQEDISNGLALEWAWDLVNDLIRLDVISAAANNTRPA